MKGLICGIKRMEIHDGDGLRTTVFFKGCPLRCVWCHNPESISPKAQIAVFENKCLQCGVCSDVCVTGAIKKGAVDFSKCTACGTCAEECPTEAISLYGEEWEDAALFEYIMQDAPFFKGGRGGITLSGGECLMQADFAISLAKMCFDAGISVNIDTSGYVPRETLEKILPYIDTFLYDIKAIDPGVHKACTSRDNALILENLEFLTKSGAKIEIRIPLVVGYNDVDEEKIAKYLSTLENIKKVKVLRYHPYAKSRYGALGMPCKLPEALTEYSHVSNFVALLRSYGLYATDGESED